MEVGVTQVVLVSVVRHRRGVDGPIVVVGLGSNVAPAFEDLILFHLAVLGDSVVLVQQVGQVDVQES